MEDSTNHFPTVIEKANPLPEKENFFIYLLAGQSNMAGRGFVQPNDTLSSSHVITLNKNNQWVYAKEPLHYYEPERTGLDCGLSFGKKLSALFGKKIIIGLVPCAVGGSSIEQWLGDSSWRGVALYSNLMAKAKIASQSGTIKGILWHQGEANANIRTYKQYQEKLKTFLTAVRNDLNIPDLPVYAGQLARFLNPKTYPFAESINRDLISLSASMKNFHVVNTFDLTSKPDTLHFDSQAQRIMGERFAEMVFNTK